MYSAIAKQRYQVERMDMKIKNQRTIGPKNAHLKPDLGALSDEMTLTLNTHTPLLTS